MRSLLVAAFLLVATAATAAPEIRGLSATAVGKSISVKFTLAGAFGDPELVKALQSGLPTKLEYVVEMYRNRPYWLDHGVADSRIEVIATFNSITREYLLNYRRDRHLVRSETFTDLEALQRRMATVDEPGLFDADGYPPYKLRVRVRADFGRTFVMYVVPSSVSTRWRDVRVVVEPKP